MTVGAVVAQLRLDMTNFRDGMAKANSLLDQYGQQASRAATMLAGFAAAAAGGLAVAVKWSAEFEAQMRNVNSILHESEPNIKALGDAVLDLAGKTGQGPAVLARGLYDIASSGFEGAEGLKVLEAAAKAATAGLTNTATASRAITGVLNAYHLSASDAGYVSDVLFKTVERGVITFEELAQNLGDVISMAATAKVPLEELGAAIAAMTKAGIQPAEAFTALNMVIRSIIAPTKESAAVAEELGLQWNATTLATKGLAGMYGDLGHALKSSAQDVDALTKAGASDAEVMELVAQNAGVSIEKLTALVPEVRGLKAALVLAAEGGDIFAKELQFMAEATGATAKALAEQSKSFQVQWQKTWATIQALGIEAGAVLLPALKSVTGVLKTLAEVLRAVGNAAPILRSLLVVVVALTAGFAALTASMILYNSQVKASIPLILGMLSATKQMVVGLATTNVTLATVTGGFTRLAVAAKGALAAVKGISLASLASAGGLAALAGAGYAVNKGLLSAAEAMRTTQDELMELVDKAQKAGLVLPVGLYQNLQAPPMLEWVSGMRQALGMAPLREVEQLRKQREMLKALVDEYGDYAGKRVEAETEAQQRLKSLRETALTNALEAIEAERQARIKAGVDEQTANEIAERERVAARQSANVAALKLEAQLQEAEGKTHEARINAIVAEAAEWRAQNEKSLGKEKAAEGARRLVTARLKALDRQEAEERAQAFEKAAGEVVSTWLDAAEAMRQADKLTTSEHLDQLTKIHALIGQINTARAAAGQQPLFAQEDLRIAQTIFTEKKRMQSELEAGEKKLADERKQWAQDELAERQRLNQYELSLIDLTFQHKRDLALITGREDEQTTAQIAREELAALQQRRETEDLGAQARLDSLERERQLILDISQAGAVSGTKATTMLGDVFEAMKVARAEIADQDRAAFDERRRQHEDLLKQVATEQKTLRDQLTETGGRITQVAQSVFDELEKRIKALGGIKLEPAFAGAGGGGRVYNINVDSAAVAASPAARKAIEDLIRAIAPEAVADDIEGSILYPRD